MVNFNATKCKVISLGGSRFYLDFKNKEKGYDFTGIEDTLLSVTSMGKGGPLLPKPNCLDLKEIITPNIQIQHV